MAKPLWNGVDYITKYQWLISFYFKKELYTFYLLHVIFTINFQGPNFHCIKLTISVLSNFSEDLSPNFTVDVRVFCMVCILILKVLLIFVVHFIQNARYLLDVTSVFVLELSFSFHFRMWRKLCLLLPLLQSTSFSSHQKLEKDLEGWVIF